MGGDVAELLRRPAIELAQMIREGQIRAQELVEAALSQIATRPDLNAFTYVGADGALAAAGMVAPGDPRPFAGVPTAIKELCPVADQPLTMGSDIFGDYRSRYDAYVVRRLKDAGFALVGRTNSPEFGIVPVTESRRFGATRNPWNPTRTPGGSSGGAAAAVAAGILPVAHGSDGGGSLRIPAACCGLVGLKPSRGRISSGPDLGDNMLSTNGALTRTVADAALMLDVMAGYELGDATWAPPPAEPFAVTAARPPRRLRIALTTQSPLDTPVDPVCAAAAHDAAALLAALGHEVEEVTPPVWHIPELQGDFTSLWAAAVAAGVRTGARASGGAITPEAVEPLTWMFYQQGTQQSAADLLGATARLQAYSRRLVAFFATYDILLTPALAQRPLPIGTIDTSAADPAAQFQKAAEFTPFTPVFNITGQPAMTLPLFAGEDGLPLAVQLVAAPLGEGLLLSLASQLEAAQPWASRLPPAAPHSG